MVWTNCWKKGYFIFT